MVRTLRNLADRMDALADNIDGAANEVKKEVAVAVVKNLISVTPVDTSRALSNWIAENGRSHNYSILPHVKGEHGSTRAASMSAALADAMAAIARAKPGVPIFITNNLRYIRALNNGHSQQAPAGFVERGVLIGRKTAEKAKLKVR